MGVGEGSVGVVGVGVGVVTLGVGVGVVTLGVGGMDAVQHQNPLP